MAIIHIGFCSDKNILNLFNSKLFLIILCLNHEFTITIVVGNRVKYLKICVASCTLHLTVTKTSTLCTKYWFGGHSVRTPLNKMSLFYFVCIALFFFQIALFYTFNLIETCAFSRKCIITTQTILYF